MWLWIEIVQLKDGPDPQRCYSVLLHKVVVWNLMVKGFVQTHKEIHEFMLEAGRQSSLAAWAVAHLWVLEMYIYDTCSNTILKANLRHEQGL